MSNVRYRKTLDPKEGLEFGLLGVFVWSIPLFLLALGWASEEDSRTLFICIFSLIPCTMLFFTNLQCLSDAVEYVSKYYPDFPPFQKMDSHPYDPKLADKSEIGFAVSALLVGIPFTFVCSVLFITSPSLVLPLLILIGLYFIYVGIHILYDTYCQNRSRKKPGYCGHNPDIVLWILFLHLQVLFSGSFVRIQKLTGYIEEIIMLVSMALYLGGLAGTKIYYGLRFLRILSKKDFREHLVLNQIKVSLKDLKNNTCRELANVPPDALFDSSYRLVFWRESFLTKYNPRTRVYHRPNCRYAKSAKVEYNTLFDYGGHPCRICGPSPPSNPPEWALAYIRYIFAKRELDIPDPDIPIQN